MKELKSLQYLTVHTGLFAVTNGLLMYIAMTMIMSITHTSEDSARD